MDPDGREDEDLVHLIDEIEGYPETGTTKWRAENDQVFIDACNTYNTEYGLSAGEDGYVSPKQLKAWAMVESGGEGDKDAFLSDPLQVNNPGYWAAFQRYNGNINPPPENANTTRTEHRDWYADRVIQLGR